MHFKKAIRSIGTCVLTCSITTIALTCQGSNAYAHNKNWINEQLRKFDENPKNFMKSHVEKYNVGSNNSNPFDLFTTGTTRFSEKAIQNGDFISSKLNSRKIDKTPDGRASIQTNDDPQNLVDKLTHNTLEEIEKSGLTSSNLPTSPWSDDYWPIYQGIIGKRYADPGFPYTNNWRTNTSYVRSYSCSIDQLSPAEKYDLLVGDVNRTLTHAMLNSGSEFADRNGYVEEWMGICDGWAPASYMVPRPSKSIVLPSADGRYQITFYPSDIKALASLLWARAGTEVRFIGGRCGQRSPAEDVNGRVLDPDCFDTNPASWHLSVVNQIGVSRRSLIIDATYDYEVWNQPIYSYTYRYFNPQTRAYASTLEAAMVPVKQFNNDIFRPYRSNQAEFIVGIAMDVVYIGETPPEAVHHDTADKDDRKLVTYFYDLELDRHHRIKGGEWYQREHPDFLWTPGPETKAQSVGDQYLERSHIPDWDGSSRLSGVWTEAARYASQYSQPLRKVVDTLIVLSNLGI